MADTHAAGSTAAGASGPCDGVSLWAFADSVPWDGWSLKSRARKAALCFFFVPRHVLFHEGQFHEGQRNIISADRGLKERDVPTQHKTGHRIHVSKWLLERDVEAQPASQTEHLGRQDVEQGRRSQQILGKTAASLA